MFYSPVVQCKKNKSYLKIYYSAKQLHRTIQLLLMSYIYNSKWNFFLSLQHFQCTIQALQDELRIQRDLNQLFQSDYSESCLLGSQPIPPQDMTEENFLRLHGEYERQVKELFLLRKTVEEMELRIDTQKHTLNARYR